MKLYELKKWTKLNINWNEWEFDWIDWMYWVFKKWKEFLIGIRAWDDIDELLIK
jgi:hypothetical protein